MLNLEAGSGLAQIIGQAGFDIVETAELPARAAEYLPLPLTIHPKLRKHLQDTYPNGLYAHQASAVEAALNGSDVCLATSTASGKSLVFMSLAIQRVLEDHGAKILVLYPARALIQDQMAKWAGMTGHFGLKVSFIDGSVEREHRIGIIKTSSIVLMTPDVFHAWMMGHLEDADIRNFICKIQLVVLDEAHVYDGVFGTNTAYLFRRLAAVSNNFQLVCCTATLGKPSDFIYQLTGRKVVTFGEEDDKSASSGKTIVLLRPVSADTFQPSVSLLAGIARANMARFLAFGDSRRGVEQLVAAARRPTKSDDSDDNSNQELGLLPYRAGYETEDRNSIQTALKRGALRGVVATSALELGIDIGDIDLVLMMGVPPSVKSFWQRLGRAGRKNHAACLLVDDRSRIASTKNGLAEYLRKEVEPSWLYLENKYIQYSNALCAAREIMAAGAPSDHLAVFASLPASFRSMLDNEVTPTEIIPSDLYILKQRAQAGPHIEFPLRSGVEKDFDIKAAFDKPLGSVTFSQALREAYPGAIYYYMARPYRIAHFSYKDGQIHVTAEKHWVTKPIAQAMAFPQFQGGILHLLKSNKGFIAEASIQVSERVLGFTEKRGSAKPVKHLYGVGSPYYQHELTRFFETTGVCWYFPESYLRSEDMANLLLEAFCSVSATQARDLGLGLFFSKLSPLGSEQCQGACIFDAATGSLRLTQKLAETFGEVVAEAERIATERGQVDDVASLKQLRVYLGQLQSVSVADGIPASSPAVTREWVEVVAVGEKAMYVTVAGNEEVVIKDYRYTPDGLSYEIVSADSKVRRFIACSAVQPLHGLTKLVQYNVYTGETRPLP